MLWVSGVHREKRIAVTNHIFSFSDQSNDQARSDTKCAGQHPAKFNRMELYNLPAIKAVSYVPN
jgi:hypothetical protein